MSDQRQLPDVIDHIPDVIDCIPDANLDLSEYVTSTPDEVKDPTEGDSISDSQRTNPEPHPELDNEPKVSAGDTKSDSYQVVSSLLRSADDMEDNQVDETQPTDNPSSQLSPNQNKHNSSELENKEIDDRKILTDNSSELENVEMSGGKTLTNNSLDLEKRNIDDRETLSNNSSELEKMELVEIGDRKPLTNNSLEWEKMETGGGNILTNNTTVKNIDDEIEEESDRQNLLGYATILSDRRVGEERGEEEKGMEGEQCRLLAKSNEMDNNNYQVQQERSSASSRSEEEGAELVQKPLQHPKRTCIVLCLAFFFVYTANLAIQNLQSSLNQAAGLGITSLAVLYGSIIVFGTLSPLVIRFLNAKRTLVLAFACHFLYTLSNFYSTFPTLLTASLLLGAMAGPMWTAQGLYATATGLAYAGVKQMETHAALSFINGVFFAFYEATQISGNLIASLVLQRGSYNDSTVDNNVCGAEVCPTTEMNSTKIEQPEQHIVYILMSIYLACNIVGLLLTILALPPLPRDQEVQAGESSIKKSTTSCLSMLLVPKMLLLLPFFMAQAMNSGILLSEYNQKFVSCAVGIKWVGYVMTSFGVLTSAQAVGLNYAAKLLGRRVLFTAAAIADLSVNVAMLVWDPTGTSVASLFILPCFSGFAEGIFQAQFNSLVAMVFPNQVTGAFATYHTSKATAFTITFVLARFLCLYQRLYVSVTLSTLGLLGYGIVEVMLHRSKQRQSADGDPKLVHISQGKES